MKITKFLLFNLTSLRLLAKSLKSLGIMVLFILFSLSFVSQTSEAQLQLPMQNFELNVALLYLHNTFKKSENIPSVYLVLIV